MRGKLGLTFADAVEFSSITDALHAIRALDAPTVTLQSGYIWIQHNQHWVISGNYARGRAYNGTTRDVSSSVTDLMWMARHTI